MTRRHLEIFVTVAEEMNMTSAAQRLYISQSAVSQAIKELEVQYSTKLFERLSKKLYITQAGERLLAYARHIIRLYHDISQEMKTFESHPKLRIGASVTIATSIMPSLILSFQTQLPSAEVQVFEDNTTKIEKMLLNDEIDIALVEGEIMSKDLLQEAFLEDKLIFVCSNRHKFSQTSVPIHALENENFILREIGSGTRKKFEEVMMSHNFNWHSSWTCNNADTIKEAVEKNLGITVISHRAVKRQLADGLLSTFNVENIEFKRQFRIVYHRHKFQSNIMHELIHYTKDYFKNN